MIVYHAHFSILKTAYLYKNWFQYFEDNSLTKTGFAILSNVPLCLRLVSIIQGISCSFQYFEDSLFVQKLVSIFRGQFTYKDWFCYFEQHASLFEAGLDNSRPLAIFNVQK